MKSENIEVECTRYGSTGGRYRVKYSGATLIEATRTLALSACRALLARGITGTLAMYSLGGSEPRLRVDIEKGAGLNVTEGQRNGLRFVPFVERPEIEEELDGHQDRQAA
jgi:hypothetical protein